jgi:hypothetical protein
VVKAVDNTMDMEMEGNIITEMKLNITVEMATTKQTNTMEMVDTITRLTTPKKGNNDKKSNVINNLTSLTKTKYISHSTCQAF